MLTCPPAVVKSVFGVILLMTLAPVPQAARPAAVLGHLTGTVIVQPATGSVAPVRLTLLAPIEPVRVPPVQVVLTGPPT